MGFRLSGKGLSKHIDYYETGLAGKNYRMRCWKYIIPRQYNLYQTNLREDMEIKRRAWVDHKDACIASKFPLVTTEDGRQVYITSELLVLFQMCHID